jgi:PAS domain S-box-containing protein
MFDRHSGRGRLPRWADLSLRAKGVVVVAMPVVAMVVAVGAFSLSAQQARRVEQQAANAIRERFVAHSLLIAMLDAETAVRGYLLTGREAFLDPYAEAVSATSLKLGRLKRILADEPKQEDSLRRIERLGDESLAILLELRSRPSRPRQLVLLSRSLDIRRHLRDELDAVVARENTELFETQEAAADAERLSTGIIAVSVLLGLLGGLVGMMAFSSGVIRRVRRLEANTERLAAGQPLRSLPPGDDEIGRLGRAFDAAASRLRETEGLLHGVIQGTTDVVFVKDLEGRYLLMNPAGASYLDRPLDQIVGRTDEDLYSPDLAARIRETDRDVSDTGQIHVYETTDVIASSRRIFLTTKGPFRDGSGRLVGVFGISRDITERKRLEDTLAERAEELERSNKELEQFAYVASHDLQEPLRIVAGYAELLARRYRGSLDQDADEFIGYMVDGVGRMQRLINDLLHYSRVGTKGKEPVPTDLDRVLDEALGNLGPKIEEAEAEVTADRLPTVPADEGQLVQLFQNLIGNAVKFHGDQPPRVHVGVERRNGEWELSVADNGIGIDADYRDQIFEIFQRLHARDEFEGTGIGLAICRKIVDRHGGRIWVESTPGRGSTFRFTIPAEDKNRDG